MAASTISISNRSLLSVGARAQISSLNEGSPEANALNTLFVPTFEMLGRSAYWNCLRKQAVLTLLQAAQGTPENPNGTTLPLPPPPWLYAYQDPSDCLAMRFIVPSFPSTGVSPAMTTVQNSAASSIPGSGQIPYAVAYATDSRGNPNTVILTNQSQAQAVYTVNQPNPIIWDSQFQAAMVASLAAYLVPALSLNLPLMQMSIAAAERIIQQARVRDGNEGVTVMDHIPDWIRARQGETGIYGSYNGYAPWLFGNYSNMDWP